MTRTERFCRAMCVARCIRPDGPGWPDRDEPAWTEMWAEVSTMLRHEARLLELHGDTPEPPVVVEEERVAHPGHTRYLAADALVRAIEAAAEQAAALGLDDIEAQLVAAHAVAVRRTAEAFAETPLGQLVAQANAPRAVVS